MKAPSNLDLEPRKVLWGSTETCHWAFSCFTRIRNQSLALLISRCSCRYAKWGPRAGGPAPPGFSCHQFGCVPLMRSSLQLWIKSPNVRSIHTNTSDALCDKFSTSTMPIAWFFSESSLTRGFVFCLLPGDLVTFVRRQCDIWRSRVYFTGLLSRYILALR